MSFLNVANWTMISLSFVPLRTQLWFSVDRVEGVLARAPEARRGPKRRRVGLRVAVAAVSDRQILRPVQRRRLLDGQERLAEGRLVDAVLFGKEPERVHRLVRVLLRALDGAEEERAVERDRSAERPAELIPPVVRLVGVADLFRVSPRVEGPVAEERERAAAELVRPALGHDVHHAAVAPAVFRLVALRDEVELLNRFERELLQQPADGVVVVVAAVDLVVHVAPVAAADLRRELRALGRIRVEAEADARDRRRQVGELPAVERQVLDPADVHDAADRRRAGLDERRVAGHRHALRHPRHRQRHRDIERLSDVDGDRLALEPGEALELGQEVVGADRQRRQPVDPFRVAEIRAREAGLRVPHRDHHPRDRRALGVDDSSADVAGGLLRERRTRERNGTHGDHRNDELSHACWPPDEERGFPPMAAPFRRSASWSPLGRVTGARNRLTRCAEAGSGSGPSARFGCGHPMDWFFELVLCRAVVCFQHGGNGGHGG